MNRVRANASGRTLFRSRFAQSLLAAAGRIPALVRRDGNMSITKKTIKAGIITGVCGLGLCALARKLKLSNRIADFAQNMQAVPFPGTRLYAFLASRQLRPLYSEVAEEIIRSGLDGRILDLGTGPGYLPIEIAQSKPSLSVVGMDPSGDMVRIAQAGARAAGVNKRLEFVPGDPTSLPFPGRYFDLVVSVNVLHHWADPHAVFEEVHHVLTPGGEFWIYDFKKDAPPDAWEELQKRLPIYLRPLLQLGPVASSKAAYPEEQLLEMAAATHFEDPTVEPRSLTLFGRAMPVFMRLRMRKPDQARD